MATKDPSLHEEQDRSTTDNISDRSQTPGRTDARPTHHTEVKNAHAAGDGTTGRNDADEAGSLVPEKEPLK